MGPGSCLLSMLHALCGVLCGPTLHDGGVRCSGSALPVVTTCFPIRPACPTSVGASVIQGVCVCVAGLPSFVAMAWVGVLACCMLSTVHPSSVLLVAVSAHAQHSLSRCNGLLQRRTTSYRSSTTAQRTKANPRAVS